MADGIFRRYCLKITPFKRVGDAFIKSGESIEITDPLTINFSINKIMYAGFNCTARIEVYNLNLTTRDMLFYDYLRMESFRMVELFAGYNDGAPLSLIYKGLIRYCRPKKTGTDVIMEMEAFSGLHVLEENVSVSYSENLSDEDIFNKIATKCPGISVGATSFDGKTLPRPIALMGNAVQLLKTYSNDKVSLDNEELIVLDATQVVDGLVKVIDDESGLLGIPERDRTTLTVNCMFEPRIQLGQVLEIRSKIAPVFNGQYKVWGISHNGVISGAKSAQLTTKLVLYTGANLFGKFMSEWDKVKG